MKEHLEMSHWVGICGISVARKPMAIDGWLGKLIRKGYVREAWQVRREATEDSTFPISLEVQRHSTFITMTIHIPWELVFVGETGGAAYHRDLSPQFRSVCLLRSHPIIFSSGLWAYFIIQEPQKSSTWIWLSWHLGTKDIFVRFIYELFHV